MEKLSNRSNNKDTNDNTKKSDISQKKSIGDESHMDKSYQSRMDLDGLDHALKTLIITDELEPFTLRSISPSAFSLSPIEVESFSENEYSEEDEYVESESSEESCTEISVEFINKCIAPLDCEQYIGSPRKLDTILEGVYLETPPKKRNILLRKI
ncbi:uncharacterized protein LOC113370330 [Ctenocephalides felis]|uniref:uncharacterized protein LOC113370330 n=1 Tax=Ctenocephalides felis TaxID=7515 RepID=UPI000E6E3FDB|nr:uncharacterized protein LOC113370330 [Ctenocephalides felis]